MAKGLNKNKREAKKPKADKKPAGTAAGFLPPQNTTTPPKSKGNK
jgi:hypothetical protein